MGLSEECGAAKTVFGRTGVCAGDNKFQDRIYAGMQDQSGIMPPKTEDVQNDYGHLLFLRENFFLF